MAEYLGDFPAGGTVCWTFSTFAAATGAPSAVTNFASSDIQLYKNLNATQRSSAAGITVTTSFDSNTGIQGVTIDLSDNTDAGFYAAGNEYQVIIADITVDGQTLRFDGFCFSIERANGILALLKATGSVKVDMVKLLGTTVPTPTVAGIPNVNAKTWNDLTTVALPLIPTTAGRTLDVSAGGEAGVDWANVGSPTTALDLSNTTIKTTQKVDVDTIKTNPVVNGGTATFPTNATLASTTNITAGTITTATTATNLTNAPTAGDFTATMKTSIGTAVAASAVASVTAGVTVSTNNDKTGYSLATGGIISGAHAAAELNAIADAILDRNLATGTDSGTNSTVTRTVRQALRRLRNKEAIATGTGTVYKEDDSTTSWTYAATTTAGDPLSAVDPT